MREELEVKIRVDEPERVAESILRIGGRHLSSVVEEDTYFGHPCRNFALTDEALRLRRSDGTVELTYKGPRAGGAGGTKSRTELTLRLQDPGAAAELLSALGFVPVATVRKRRSYYRVSGAIVSIDAVEGLGNFVEVEAADEGVGVEDLKSIVRGLGLAWEPVEETYLEMVLSSQK
ncbi:MAG: class IV adenylate cyclase [Conexivisphaera sp.]